ncbi:hypothetical protein MHYMCMPASI_00095 [Hyalomma marginatum]|uniref:Uncharacterized protein n=1 Tax=Hyalomma marginatum TaxID=34627 RepID=A0A8S4C1H8_9ACAR|nr:hypothetical protein MHYMCMPASI_00095 [Hyalomma marginatum]
MSSSQFDLVMSKLAASILGNIGVRTKDFLPHKYILLLSAVRPVKDIFILSSFFTVKLVRTVLLAISSFVPVQAIPILASGLSSIRGLSSLLLTASKYLLLNISPFWQAVIQLLITSSFSSTPPDSVSSSFS